MERIVAAALGRALRLDPPELLRQRSGRRALIAYRGREVDGQPFEAYGKLRIKGLDRRTPALHQRLLAAGVGTDVGVPRMLGILPEAQIWLQERVEGRLLTNLLAPGGPTEPLEAAGMALARLHRIAPGELGLPEVRSWSMEDEVATLADALARAGRARPDLAAAIGELCADLSAGGLALAPGQVTGIHRDFYPDQVIVGPAKCWLVDLDLFSLGDPTIDIANFIAHLRELGLRRWSEPNALAPQEEAFLSGYAATAPLPDQARLDLLATISLARHVWISIRIPERRHVTEAVAQECSATAVRWRPASLRKH
jgi:Ser/Thr protein kinase RdoA (MazF antagonist)